LPNIAANGFFARLRTWFPDREFFMRSEGQVRFIKVSSRVQMIGAGAAAGLLLFWILSISGMAISSYLANQDRNSLLDREAKIATAESRVSAYRDDLGKVAGDLKRRQDFIDKVVQTHLGELPTDAKAGETVSDSRTEAANTVKKVSAVLPEAAALAEIEARQLAQIEGLTRAADRRAAIAESKLARLGLSPKAMLAAINDPTAQGGPLSLLATSADGSVDPRFQRLA